MTPDPMDKDNIRQFEAIQDLIGQKLVDVTSDDIDERREDGRLVAYLHFSNGTTLEFLVETIGVHQISGDKSND